MGKFLRQKQGCIVLILQRKIIKSSKIQSQGGGIRLRRKRAKRQ